MKRILKSICCFALATTMFTTNISTVWGYTSEEIITINKSDEARKLYAVGNEDLDLFLTKSDADSTSSNTVTYSNAEEYSSNGTEEGRRAGLLKAMDQFYDGKFPKTSNAENALKRMSDSTILRENKISESDQNKDKFLSAYKVGYLDAYNVAEFQLCGYDFGYKKGYAMISDYEAKGYANIPSFSEAYSKVEDSIFSIYGVSKNSKYAEDFEKAFSKGFELGYLKESTTNDDIYNVAKVTGYETAKRLDAELESYEDLELEIKAYKSTYEYRTTRSKLIGDFKTTLTTTEANAKYDEGFDAGVAEYLGKSTDGTEEESTSENAGSIAGEAVGSEAGGLYATSDYIYGKAYNPENAYTEYLNNTNLIKVYKLNVMPTDYINAFESGLKNEFMLSYTNTYNTMKSDNIESSTFVQLPDQGDIVSDSKITAVSNNLLVEFAIDFGSGNFFSKSYLNIYDTGRYWQHDSNRYTAYSNLYNIEVYNEKNGARQNFITLTKPAKITFTHELGENVGVYKIVGNQLRYMHTEFDIADGGTVFATIPAGKYYGGQYILLADEKLPKAKDIANNWNYKGLDTYLRRGWLPVKNEKANPESNITRAELAFMLERNLNKNNEVVSAPVKYADANKFYGYDNAINYCVSKGYLTVNSKNQFRPQDKVTYSELEAVLGRALNYKVSFKTYSDKMKTTYFKKSKYESGKNNYITKSETVFVLNDIFQ